MKSRGRTFATATSRNKENQRNGINNIYPAL
jgi:hypothetical protein